MSKRIIWEYDPDPDLSWLEQWNTPEKYRGNEVYENGKPLPFDEYIQYHGNPEHHIMLACHIQETCPHCGTWVTTDACHGFDFADWQDPLPDVGTYTLEQAKDLANEYQKDTSISMYMEADTP